MLARTLKLREGRTVPLREAKLKAPEERMAAIERIAGSFETDVIVDRSLSAAAAGSRP